MEADETKFRASKWYAHMLCKGLIFTEEKEVFLNHMYQGVGIWRSINSMLKLWKQRITAQKKNNKLKIIRNWAGKEIFCSAAEETPRLFLLPFCYKNPFPVRCWLRVAPAGMCSGLSALWFHRAVCEITLHFGDISVQTEELLLKSFSCSEVRLCLTLTRGHWT